MESKKLAELQPGVVVDIIQCDGDWCRVDAQGYKGWLHQERLWGIYPDETVDD
ncbi:MAG: SH3 domain-containing protein [Bdellovibrionales bacterium]